MLKTQERFKSERGSLFTKEHRVKSVQIQRFF